VQTVLQQLLVHVRQRLVSLLLVLPSPIQQMEVPLWLRVSAADIP
jgi:hypothetical protein